jgi:hypothetical protein
MSLQPATPPLTSHGEPAGSPFAGMDICAAVGLRVAPGARGPLFEQDVWDFTAVDGLPAYMQPSTRRMDFTAITNRRWRLVAKEHVIATLLPSHDRVSDLPHARRNPLTLQTSSQRLVEMARWLNWLTTNGVSTLAQVTDWHCEAYAAERAAHQPVRGARSGDPAHGRVTAMTAIIELALYRDLFTSDRYPASLRPFGGRNVTAASARPLPAENVTPVVPAAVLQPVLAAALYLVQTLGPHIVAEHHRRRAQLQLPARPRLTRNTRISEIIAAVQRQVAEGRPLERLQADVARYHVAAGHTATDDPLAEVSATAVAREAGIRLTTIPAALRPVLLDAVERVGVEYPWGRNAQQVARADGEGSVPWTDPIDDRRAFFLRRVLRSACVVVIGAVSGMRASELLELLVGCRQQPQQIAGGLVRYRISSKVIKGAPPGGLDDEWIVTREVFDAVGIAEQLLDQPEPGTLLLAPCSFSVHYVFFRAWVNSPEGQRLGLALIPDGQVNLRMLRRTLAVELAYRPGGLLAAKVHLKHISVVTTEGYANRPGGSQARFLAEIGEAEQQRNLATLLAEYQNFRSDIMPTGPGARELISFFTSIDAKLTDLAELPALIHSDQQLRTLLTKRAATLHLGVANYCWFTDPAKALCLKLAGTPDATTPLIGMCDSARCPQATHHSCHRPVWAAASDQHKVFLGTISRAQKTERARLQAEIDRADRIVAVIDAASTTPAGGEACPG